MAFIWRSCSWREGLEEDFPRALRDVFSPSLGNAKLSMQLLRAAAAAATDNNAQFKICAMRRIS
jgi:hypothetical protein